MELLGHFVAHGDSYAGNEAVYGDGFDVWFQRVNQNSQALHDPGRDPCIFLPRLFPFGERGKLCAQIAQIPQVAA